MHANTRPALAPEAKAALHGMERHKGAAWELWHPPSCPTCEPALPSYLPPAGPESSPGDAKGDSHKRVQSHSQSLSAPSRPTCGPALPSHWPPAGPKAACEVTHTNTHKARASAHHHVPDAGQQAVKVELEVAGDGDGVGPPRNLVHLAGRGGWAVGEEARAVNHRPERCTELVVGGDGRGHCALASTCREGSEGGTLQKHARQCRREPGAAVGLTTADSRAAGLPCCDSSSSSSGGSWQERWRPPPPCCRCPSYCTRTGLRGPGSRQEGQCLSTRQGQKKRREKGPKAVQRGHSRWRDRPASKAPLTTATAPHALTLAGCPRPRQSTMPLPEQPNSKTSWQPALTLDVSPVALDHVNQVVHGAVLLEQQVAVVDLVLLPNRETQHASEQRQNTVQLWTLHSC